MNSYSTIFDWLSFAFCLSATAGGMLMLFRRKQTELGAEFAFFQYYFILVSVYGFYGLWSRHLLTVVEGFDGVEYVAEIVNVLVSPFFVVGLVMLLLWGCRLQQRSALMVIPAVGLLVATLIGVLIAIDEGALLDANGMVALAGAVASIGFVVLVATGKKEVLAKQDLLYLLGGFLALAVLYTTRFSVLVALPSYQTLFNILYFALHSALVVLYIVRAPSMAMASPETAGSFAQFVEKYGISKRETDIVKGIYAGMTNQEIANSLFITLQTVKDHTSRIYQKVFVKNRGQLVALLREGALRD